MKETVSDSEDADSDPKLEDFEGLAFKPVQDGLTITRTWALMI
jgi:hypothetical protein